MRCEIPRITTNHFMVHFTIIGFIDLQSRLAEVVSMLEVGPNWLEPTKFDLTFTNVKTQKCVINNTEVHRAGYQGFFS